MKIRSSFSIVLHLWNNNCLKILLQNWNVKTTKAIVFGELGLNKNDLDLSGIYVDHKRIYWVNLQYYTKFLQNKKLSSEVFPLFAKKARGSL
ncbi:hypothetical protein CMU79_07100 [Elizabethkingia anophelis]|nr:hypothetical protein [Elizabethkingia anophelis]MDV3618366.1 hypothetical protein [Elizabethkingia anophelis]